MGKDLTKKDKVENKKASIFALLKPYKRVINFLIVLAIVSNLAGLILPKLISYGIDDYVKGTLDLSTVIWEFGLISLFIFILTYAQSVVQTYASERVARDLRADLTAKISRQSYLFVQNSNPSKLLTNLTSDIDSVKMFVAQAIVSLVSSVVIIIGASVLLLTINWKLALAVLTILPIIGGTFFLVLKQVRVLFKESREVIDWLNKIINESILGAALVRVLNSKKKEADKFSEANTNAKNIGMKILNMFASMIPVVTFFANVGTLIVLSLGGHFVISGSMSLGEFAAFISYIAVLIFPIFVIGFMSNIIAQSGASYQRIYDVLSAAELPEGGSIKTALKGDIELKKVNVIYGEKPALKDVSFKVKAGTKVAIIGPTAAGKSQLLYLLTGLTKPDSGVVEFDGKNLDQYERSALHKQTGFVFQDSILFNMTLRENIAFSPDATDESLQKAIDTAELRDFIKELPDGLQTVVSERGTSLSGGQKQRVMLARALALNPRILFLDDFTARVDNRTEQKILKNLEKNYPDLTLISVTQKISSIEEYDQIVVLMEGELLAKGTHKELMESSPEYVQIYNSQRSTNQYELHT
ncbi:MAG: ABC transporter ATP-binding protein [Patescibacteria group bacterium]